MFLSVTKVLVYIAKNGIIIVDSQTKSIGNKKKLCRENPWQPIILEKVILFDPQPTDDVDIYDMFIYICICIYICIYIYIYNF